MQIIEQVSSLVKTFFKLYEIRVQFSTSFRSSTLVRFVKVPTSELCQENYTCIGSLVSGPGANNNTICPQPAS